MAKPYALRSQLQTISERLSRIGGKGQADAAIEWRHADPLGTAPAAASSRQHHPGLRRPSASACWSTPGNCAPASVMPSVEIVVAAS